MFTQEELVRFRSKIGTFLDIPNIGSGQLKFIGLVKDKPGYYAGIDLLSNTGKNNGSFNGIEYFSCSFPRSGLFVQLCKIKDLIEEASVFAEEGYMLKTNVTGTKSNFYESNTKQHKSLPESSLSHATVTSHNGECYSSMGSVRSVPVNEDTASVIAKENSNSIIDHVDVDYPFKILHKSAGKVRDTNFDIIDKYQFRITEQNCQLAEYKKLLNEQSQVLEEIQPIVDEYIKKVHSLEIAIEENRIEYEQNISTYELENKQLSGVIAQLHDELQKAERSLIISTSSPSNNDFLNYTALQEELNNLRNYKKTMMNAKMGWENEKKQLKMQNEVLNNENRLLHIELVALNSFINSPKNKDNSQYIKVEQNPEVSEKQIATERSAHSEALLHAQQCNSEDVRSVPTFIPPRKVDASAGRRQWCVLCERDGHESMECPYQ